MTDLFENFKVDVDFDSKVDYDEYKRIVKDNIITILRQHFVSNRQKQTITEHHDRISFACPICDDSMSNHTKKRGNYILKGKFANHIKCFNCGYFSNVEDFFKKYKITLDLNVINYISEHKAELQRTVKYDTTFLFDTVTINLLSINREEFKEFFKLYEVNGTYAKTYLENRLVYETDRFLYDIKNNDIIILNLTDEGKIIGFQRRALNKYAKQKYKSYKLSKMYELMGKNVSLVPDDIDALSTIFNACIVDWTRPVTAFEGPIDSFLFKNSVAITGVHKSLNFELYMRYWLDNDDAGLKKSIKLLEDGNSVFLWGKFMSEYNIPKRKKWDLNDLLIYLRQKNIYINNFNKYFSTSVLDMIDL